MSQTRKVLIADPDLAHVRPLTKALRQRGYHVQYAPDGTRALEIAVMRHPDVILFDDQCKLIESHNFVQILATNPRTDDIPVVFTTGRRDAERPRSPLAQGQGVLQKPYNLDEVSARIENLCRRAETARELRGEASEIEGTLTQLPLADLLQILALNRRTGKLMLAQDRARGEVNLSLGRPINAHLDELEGEKAFFRLARWREGTFAFVPGPATTRVRIDRVMGEALMEAMRQGDERERLLQGLPAPSRTIALSPDAPTVVEPHAVTAEVLRVLSQPRRIIDVLDCADAPDLEILAALSALLEKGVVTLHEGHTPVVEGPMLGAAETHALRGKLMRGRAARNALIAKVVVCGTGAKTGRWLLRALPGFVRQGKDPGCLRSSFGTLGRLEVNDVLRVDFIYLPVAEAARPLWRPFMTGALGALVVEHTEGVLNLARYCAFELRLPVVFATGRASNSQAAASHSLPAALEGAPLGATVVDTDISAAVRTLLLAAMTAPASGQLPEPAVVRHRRGL